MSISMNNESLRLNTNNTPYSRGVKRQNGNKSLPYKTYFPRGSTQNNHGFQCSLAQIKSRYPLSGLFREKTVKTLHGWISWSALTAPTNMNSLLYAKVSLWILRSKFPLCCMSVQTNVSLSERQGQCILELKYLQVKRSPLKWWISVSR